MGKKWKYQSLRCVQRFAARQAPLSRMVPINKTERKVLCSQTKLSFIASTLAYPHWRNVSVLKLARGVLILWNSLGQQSWWKMLSFVKFAFWNGGYLSIIFFFSLVYGQNYIFSHELVLSTSKVDHRCWQWEAGKLGSCLWDLWI